jgi:hypothetical protein
LRAQVRDHWVMLKSLEFHVRECVRVFVPKVHNKAHVNLIIVEVVDERSAACARFLQRPAHCVGHGAFGMLGRVDLPDFLHAKAIFLHVASGSQIVFCDGFF